MESTDGLRTVANYAKQEGVTAAYIYKLVKENKMKFVEINGVKFVDTNVYPSIRR